jgi:hypothetical protein
VAIEHACERCESTSVTRQAWAEWDAEGQCWVLATLFDYAFCLSCYKPTHLLARPVPVPD